MIFKIDHISIGTTQFEDDISLLKTFGYKDLFIERNLQNMQNTINIMDDFATTFNMSLLTKENSISIEILDYEQKLSSSSQRTQLNNHMNYEIGTNCLKNFIDHIFDTIEIKTNNIQSSVKFWELFRFKVISCENGNALLQFNNTLLKQSFFIRLVEVKEGISNIKINEPSFNLLAFISTNIHKDYLKFKKAGYNITKINTLTVNNKDLEICFVYSPTGELAELIGIK